MELQAADQMVRDNIKLLVEEVNETTLHAFYFHTRMKVS